MSSKKVNDTECASSFAARDTPFLSPDTSAVFKPGDTAYVTWYAGVIPEGTGSPATNTTFNLILSAFRDDSFVYDVLKNTTVPFSGRVYDQPVYWSYIPDAVCAATEISYFWSIPTNFTPASTTDFDYVLLVETIISTGWALSQSEPFRIVALPSTSTSSTSPTSSASSVDGSMPTDSADSNSTSYSPSESSAHSLRPGAKAGIAVGSIAGALALILGAWFVYRKRRKADTNTQTGKTHAYEGVMTADNLDGGGANAAVSGNEKVEIDGRQMPRESGGTALHELEAVSRRDQRDITDNTVEMLV